MEAEGGAQNNSRVGDAAGTPPPADGRVTVDGVRLLYGEVRVAVPDQARALQALRRVYEDDRSRHSGKRWQPAELPQGVIVDEVLEAMGWLVEPGGETGLIRLVPAAAAAQYFPAWFEALAPYARVGSQVIGVGEGGLLVRWAAMGGAVERQFATWLDFAMHLDTLKGGGRSPAVKGGTGARG